MCLLAGCASPNKSLTDVNKNWDTMIRASHIYPVYPLTEDLQPGDIFWVTNRIEDITIWKQKGYLKLDRQIGRINVTNYPSFYASAFDYANQTIPKSFISSVTWSNAPIAAFPSYGFTIQQGGGANVSLPIQGIPVGLAIMGAKSVSGQVTIAEAHTYGIDEFTLQKMVGEFAKSNYKMLTNMLSAESSGTGYLRVVSRIYATKRVAVSMFKDSGLGVTASGGVPKDFSIPTLTTTNAAENYSNLVNAVNGVVSANQTAFADVKNLAPGGTFKFNSVSSDSVSLAEEFDRPLVIGYLGFDMKITRDSLESLLSQNSSSGDAPLLPAAIGFPAQ